MSDILPSNQAKEMDLNEFFLLFFFFVNNENPFWFTCVEWQTTTIWHLTHQIFHLSHNTATTLLV